MSSLMQPLILLLQACNSKSIDTPQRGRPYVYGHISMLLFFITMALKGIHSFKAMADYAAVHYERFGFCSAPSRKTIRRRFLALPKWLSCWLPIVAQEATVFDERFCFRTACVDKSVFRAKGGIWHKKHRLQGIVPHPSIDTDASWGKSAYHGWRFGYGLHLVANCYRFPVMDCVQTASGKDYHQLLHLLTPLLERCRLVIADAGYRSIQVIMKLWKALEIFVLLQTPFKSESKNKCWYNQQIAHYCAGLLYRKRGPSIEPVFAIIKELFKLKGEAQLPYRGLAKVDSYLMLTTATVQIMMIFNSIHGNPLQATKPFRFELD